MLCAVFSMHLFRRGAENRNVYGWYKVGLTHALTQVSVCSTTFLF